MAHIWKPLTWMVNMHMVQYYCETWPYYTPNLPLLLWRWYSPKPWADMIHQSWEFGKAIYKTPFAEPVTLTYVCLTTMCYGYVEPNMQPSILNREYTHRKNWNPIFTHAYLHHHLKSTHFWSSSVSIFNTIPVSLPIHKLQ